MTVIKTKFLQAVSFQCRSLPLGVAESKSKLLNNSEVNQQLTENDIANCGSQGASGLTELLQSGRFRESLFTLFLSKDKNLQRTQKCMFIIKIFNTCLFLQNQLWLKTLMGQHTIANYILIYQKKNPVCKKKLEGQIFYIEKFVISSNFLISCTVRPQVI